MQEEKFKARNCAFEHKVWNLQQLSNGLPNTASTQSFASLSTIMRGNFKLEAISKAQTMAVASALDESKAAICLSQACVIIPE